MINIQKQIRFWSFLGPLMTLMIFALTLVKQSPTSSGLAFLAMGGLVSCWIWRMKGLLISLALVIGNLAYFFPTVEMSERFWFLGLAMATALSFIVTVLSYEEIETLVSRLQRSLGKQLQAQKQEAQKQEKLAVDRDWLLDQKEELEKQLQSVKTVLAEKQKQIQKLEAVSTTAPREEIAEKSSAANPDSMTETHEKMAEKYQVRTGEAASSHHYESLYKQLRNQFSEKGRLLDKTRRELFAAQEKAACLARDVEEITKYKSDDYYTRLEKEFIELYQELEMRDQMYRDEISELEGLVGVLMEQN